MKETGEKKEKNKLKLIGWSVLAVVLLASVIAAFWNWVDLQKKPLEGTKRQFDASLDFVKTTATIVGGVVLYLNFRVAKESVEVAQKKLDQEQKKLDQEIEKAKNDAKLAEARLTMERFSKAVDMMGNDKSIHLRLGGIYALESIALDSSDEKIDENYRQVLEVLTAFVRENAKLKPEESTIPWQTIEQPTGEVGGQHDEIPSLPTDIQAALNVLNRRKHKDKDWEQSPLDLRKTDLRKANLVDANFQRANLSAANLQKAFLYQANLQKAFLGVTDLQKVTLYQANLQKAFLYQANLQEAFLAGANLQEADLGVANLQEADLNMANLKGAVLREANLQEVNLQEAILLYTDLRNTRNCTQECLEGDMPPFLCNVVLPESCMVNPDRDCDRLPQELVKRYPDQFPSLEEAKQYVDEERQKKWE